MITDVLDQWTPHQPAQRALLAEYRTFVAASGPAAVDRALAPAHLTASCFVLTSDLTRVLLCFHRKGQFWVQLGGHLEPADDLPAGTPGDFPDRLRTVLDEVRSR